ncbi:MAG: hypothetical protein ACT4NX_09630 [Deltaproteobacteria bacterium]
MNTPDHAYWTYALFRGKPWVAKAAVASVLPDLAFTLSSIYYFAAYGFSMSVWDRAFQSELAKPLAYAAHSIPVFTLMLAAAIIAGRRGWFPYFWGWGLHIASDVATHVSDAQPVLWPLSDAVFPSVLSYWEDAYYGGEFTAANLALQGVFALYLLMPRSSKLFQSKSAGRAAFFGFFALYILSGLFLMFRHGYIIGGAAGLYLIPPALFLLVALKSLGFAGKRG